MAKSLFLMVALCAGTAAWAGDGLPDPAMVAEALDQHPLVAAARARVAAAEADGRAIAKGTHEFTLTGSVNRRTVDREGQFTEYDALLTRPVRLPGKAALDRDIAAHGLDAARNRAEDARHQTALVLAEAWWDWLAAGAEARVDGVIAGNYTRLAGIARRRESLGDAARLDVDQAEAALGTARAAQEQSLGRERRARARLAAQFPALALPAEAPEVPEAALPTGGLEHFRDLILTNSHEIGAAQAEAARSSSMARRAQRERWADPSIGVRLFSERGGMERGGGLVVSIPLGGGHRSALADRAAADSVAADAELRAVRAGVAEVAATDQAEAEYRFAAWQRSREALNALVAALGKQRRGYELGEIDLTDLLMAERLVGEGFRGEALARAEAHRAITRIEIDSHELWLKD